MSRPYLNINRRYCKRCEKWFCIIPPPFSCPDCGKTLRRGSKYSSNHKGGRYYAKLEQLVAVAEKV